MANGIRRTSEGMAERQSDGPRGRIVAESRAAEWTYDTNLADHGQMVRELPRTASAEYARFSRWAQSFLPPARFPCCSVEIQQHVESIGLLAAGEDVQCRR